MQRFPGSLVTSGPNPATLSPAPKTMPPRITKGAKRPSLNSPPDTRKPALFLSGSAAGARKSRTNPPLFPGYSALARPFLVQKNSPETSPRFLRFPSLIRVTSCPFVVLPSDPFHGHPPATPPAVLRQSPLYFRAIPQYSGPNRPKKSAPDPLPHRSSSHLAPPAFRWCPNSTQRRSAEAASPSRRLWRHPFSGSLPALENRLPDPSSAPLRDYPRSRKISRKLPSIFGLFRDTSAFFPHLLESV